MSNRTLAFPSRHVCFEAVAHKYNIYPMDGADHAAMRAKAYAYCRIDPSRKPRTLLIESRAHDPWERTVPRRIVNLEQLRRDLSRVAQELNLTVRAATFGDLDYCGQAHVVAGSAILVGVHGQGLSNTIFQRPGALTVELFHPWYGDRPDGHNTLAIAAGKLYVAAPFALSTCGQGTTYQDMQRWKFDKRCGTVVDGKALVQLLREPRVRGLIGTWPPYGNFEAGGVD